MIKFKGVDWDIPAGTKGEHLNTIKGIGVFIFGAFFSISIFTALVMILVWDFQCINIVFRGLAISLIFLLPGFFNKKNNP